MSIIVNPSKNIFADVIIKCGPLEYRGQFHGINRIMVLGHAKRYAAEWFNKYHNNAADVYSVRLTEVVWS